MLKSLQIDSLFGLYSYNLNFNSSVENTNTFLTAPNGYGKTTLLSLIFAIYNYDLDFIFNTPFNDLTMEWEDARLCISKEKRVNEDEDSDVEEDSSLSMTLDFSKLTDGTVNFNHKFTIGANEDQWKDQDTPLKLYLESLEIYYIKDQRLNNKSARTGTHDKNQISNSKIDSATVEKNALKLKEKLINISNKLLIYQAEELLKQSLENSLDKTDLNSLNKSISSLREWGIYSGPDLNENDAPELINLLSINLKKLNPEIKLLNLFYEIINRSKFAYKTFEINSRFGYRFISHNNEGSILRNNQLSSGEQHILIQTFELLFQAPKKALILIDEPEISLHLAWQMQYLKNLRAIAKEREFQCIVGTHSPQIFDSEWNISIDLFDNFSK